MNIENLVNDYKKLKDSLQEIEWILVHWDVEEENKKVKYHNTLSKLYYDIKDKIQSVKITYHDNNERESRVYFDKKLAEYFYEILIKRRDEIQEEINSLESKIN